MIASLRRLQSSFWMPTICVLAVVTRLPVAQAQAPTNDDARQAAVNLQDPPGVASTFPINPPQEFDIKDTAYPIPQGAIFVSPEGKADSAGTLAAPTTIQAAIANAPAGTTIVLRGGTYRGVDTRPKQALTFQAYPHEKAWLNGGAVVSDWVQDGNAWRAAWTKFYPPNEKDIGSGVVKPLQKG